MSRAKVSLAAILLLGLIEVRPLAAQIPAYSEPSRKILRISLVCRDIEATSKLWAEILAVPAPQITMTKPSSESPLEFRSTAPSAEFKRALLQIGGTPVEFLQPIGSVESPEAEFTKKYPAGVRRVLFGLVDSTAVERFKKLGLTKRSQGGRDIYVESADKLGVATEWIVLKDQTSLDAMAASKVTSVQSPATTSYSELRTLAQVALVTSDFKGLNQRWAEVLGVSPPTLPINPQGQGHSLFRGRLTNAYNEATRAFSFGDVVIEIIQVVNRDGGSLMVEFQDKRGEGVQHLCFRVNAANMDEVVKHFQQFGLGLGMVGVQQGTASQPNSKGPHFIEALEKLGVDVELLSNPTYTSLRLPHL